MQISPDEHYAYPSTAILQNYINVDVRFEETVKFNNVFVTQVSMEFNFLQDLQKVNYVTCLNCRHYLNPISHQLIQFY